ncbi:hypothetical protein OEZ80_25930, partial [Leclercia adecarboxylata]|uniref:hypothetical protein n=1 Tax=Leclercia adecarboxylata TaxID=83655 RepID=UPI00234C0F16
IGDARPLCDYLDTLSGARLHPRRAERCDDALAAIADPARPQLFAAEILVGLGKPSWPGFDFRAANELARHACAPTCARQLRSSLIHADREDHGLRGEPTPTPVAPCSQP